MPRLALVIAALTLVGCASTLSPPYRDYEVRSSSADLSGALEAAAAEAGWMLAAPAAPKTVTTARREVERGLLSTTTAALDLVPLDGGHVRVYVHAERRSILGGRSKVFALDDGLRRSVLGPISEAMAARGLVALGTPRDRDEDATE